jgi:hypothetical protein
MALRILPPAKDVSLVRGTSSMEMRSRLQE